MAQVPTVTEVVTRIKNLLEGEFRALSLTGEISNLSHSSSGHWYFTLSDKNSAISVALFKADAFRNPLIKQLKDGDKIICSGSVGVYSKRGTFQIIAKRISPAGKGDLKAEFEKLKKKLAGDGLFDLERKRPIPELPRRIGVITAKSSAALQDFLSIMDRRCHWHDILISDALVQGDQAPESIRKSLFNLIKYSLEAPEEKKLDVILLTRGGGSMEDLWAFNDEALAWDIFNSPIPIISAVGHEVDFSISDMVADLRMETPSAAAELLSNKQTELSSSLNTSRKHLHNHMNDKLRQQKYLLQEVHPRTLIDIFYERLHGYQKRMNQFNFKDRGAEILKIYEKSIYLDDLQRRSFDKIYNRSIHLKNRLNKANELLRVLNPNNVLSRGYTLVRDENNSVVSSKKIFSKIKQNAELEIVFSDGSGTVKKVGQ